MVPDVVVRESGSPAGGSPHGKVPAGPVGLVGLGIVAIGRLGRIVVGPCSAWRAASKEIITGSSSGWGSSWFFMVSSRIFLSQPGRGFKSFKVQTFAKDTLSSGTSRGDALPMPTARTGGAAAPLRRR